MKNSKAEKANTASLLQEMSIYEAFKSPCPAAMTLPKQIPSTLLITCHQTQEISGGIQDQVGWDPGQTDQVVGNPAQGGWN